MKKVIKKFIEYIKESSYVDYFGILYEKAPKKLREIIDSTKHVNQNPLWHPENDVYTHTRLVTNRLANAYPNNKNLLLAGLFHDLGKIETTKWDEIKQSWTARGHEDISVKIVDQYQNWIKKMGGNPTVVRNIVQNHMRIKYLDEFRLQNKIEIVNNPNFNDVIKFNSADYGGDSLGVKPLEDMSGLYKEIENYQKKQKINKIVNSKFNGNIIMEIYPHLKGKDLGDAITQFKKHIEDKFNMDFYDFVLDNDEDFILNEFNLFII